MYLPFEIPERVKKPTAIFMACRPDGFAHCIMAAPNSSGFKHDAPELLYFSGQPGSTMRRHGPVTASSQAAQRHRFEYIDGEMALSAAAHPIHGLVTVETWEMPASPLSVCNLNDYQIKLIGNGLDPDNWSHNTAGCDLDIALRLVDIPASTFKKLQELVESLVTREASGHFKLATVDDDTDRFEVVGETDLGSRQLYLLFSELVAHARPVAESEPANNDKDIKRVAQHFLTLIGNLSQPHQLLVNHEKVYAAATPGSLLALLLPPFQAANAMIRGLRQA